MQHLSSVVIFVTSFIAIFRERVSPVGVVGISTLATIMGWAAWELGWKQREAVTEKAGLNVGGYAQQSERVGDGESLSSGPESVSSVKGLGLDMTSIQSHSSPASSVTTELSDSPISSPVMAKDYSSALRRARIMTTAKSALLIYCEFSFSCYNNYMGKTGY